MKVLLDPEEGPVLPEEDPDMRKALLASLQSYQTERDARPTFRRGSVPSRYARPSAQYPQPSTSRYFAQLNAGQTSCKVEIVLMSWTLPEYEAALSWF